MLFHLAEKYRSFLTAHVLGLVACYLFGGGVEGVDAPLQIGRYDAGAYGFDNALVQRAQVRERLSCRDQLHIRMRLSLSESRGQKTHYEECNVVEAYSLNGLYSRGFERGDRVMRKIAKGRRERERCEC